MNPLDITHRICKGKVKSGRRCARRLRPSVLYCWQHKVQPGCLAHETNIGAEARTSDPELQRVLSNRYSPASRGPSGSPQLTAPDFQGHGDRDGSGTITVNQDCGNTSNQNCGNTMNQNCGNTTTTNNSTSQIINLTESIVSILLKSELAYCLTGQTSMYCRPRKQPPNTTPTSIPSSQTASQCSSGPMIHLSRRWRKRLSWR